MSIYGCLTFKPIIPAAKLDRGRSNVLGNLATRLVTWVRSSSQFSCQNSIDRLLDSIFKNDIHILCRPRRLLVYLLDSTTEQKVYFYFLFFYYYFYCVYFFCYSTHVCNVVPCEQFVACTNFLVVQPNKFGLCLHLRSQLSSHSPHIPAHTDCVLSCNTLPLETTLTESYY